MTIDRPWELLWVTGPLLWTVLSWRGSRNRRGLLLKALSLSAILIAYSEPTIRIPERKTGLAVLVDASESATAADMQQAALLVAQISAHQQGNWMGVTPFAEGSLAGGQQCACH
jgi:hypothetical protein